MPIRFNMNLKILLRTFTPALVWLTLLTLQYFAPQFILVRFLSTGVMLGILIGTLLVCLFSPPKYLIGLTMDKDLVALTYLNWRGRQKQTIFGLDTLIKVSFQPRNLLRIDLGRLKLFQQGKHHTFLVYERGLNQAIETLVQRALITDGRGQH
jgi:hypothetical protein